MIITLPILSLIISVVACLIGAFCLWQVKKLNRLKKIFFAGSNAQDLENVIRTLEADLANEKEKLEQTQEKLDTLKQAFALSIQKLGLVRFNPFEDGGGNFSFSLALLDENNSGVILTSMHGRQQNRVYTKKIVNGKSELQLTEEEISAYNQANKT